MQPEDILREIKDSGMVQPEFWYIYSLVITTLLVSLIISIIILVRGFLSSFMSEMKITNTQFSKSIAALTTMIEVHEVEISHNKEDIKELKAAASKRGR